MDLLHGPHVSTKYRQEGGDQIDLSQAESDHDVLKKKMGTRKGRSFLFQVLTILLYIVDPFAIFQSREFYGQNANYMIFLLCIYVLHTHIYIYRVLKVMFLANPPLPFFSPSIFWGDVLGDDDQLQPRSFFEVSKKQDGQADGRFLIFFTGMDGC